MSIQWTLEQAIERAHDTWNEVEDTALGEHSEAVRWNMYLIEIQGMAYDWPVEYPLALELELLPPETLKIIWERLTA